TCPDYIFDGLPPTIEVGRYHSWVVDREGLPDCLEVTAFSPDGEIMAMRHRTLDIRGVQFHPESILTPQGLQLISNWLRH
ncbi:MAG: gamma-glutamyl-gamma-aminobutyrate hydrolase family protein, partial [Duncaniella sp.]|nr:gamma-glutamyl-gamma-aminobutyrate hydrolase family protein [Duncaniella sp.]